MPSSNTSPIKQSRMDHLMQYVAHRESCYIDLTVTFLSRLSHLTIKAFQVIQTIEDAIKPSKSYRNHLLFHKKQTSTFSTQFPCRSNIFHFQWQLQDSYFQQIQAINYDFCPQ